MSTEDHVASSVEDLMASLTEDPLAPLYEDAILAFDEEFASLEEGAVLSEGGLVAPERGVVVPLHISLFIPKIRNSDGAWIVDACPHDITAIDMAIPNLPKINGHYFMVS